MAFKSFFTKSNALLSESLIGNLDGSDDDTTCLLGDNSISQHSTNLDDGYGLSEGKEGKPSINNGNVDTKSSSLNAQKPNSKVGTKSSDTSNFTTDLLYYSKGAVNVGQVMRYKVKYTPPPNTPFEPNLFLKIKNIEVVALRAAYLAGPFILYVDVRPDHYDQNKKTYSQADHPHYEPQLKAGQSFYAPLYLNHQDDSLEALEPNAKNDSNDSRSSSNQYPNSQNTPKTSYSWTIDIVSQILFSNTAQVQFELSIARSKEALKTVPSYASKIFGPVDGLLVSKYDTIDLWNSPVPRPDPLGTNPVHLVIITHGLHSNVGADMLYLKEAIDAAAEKTGENIIVRGYFGNVGKTEKGVRFLGCRLAEYIVKTVNSELFTGSTKVKKISFVAHSLGGLVQTYALAHIATHYPDFFLDITPVNFIALASPFLGISNENPYYVKFALDIGFVGKTGQDLSLRQPIPQGKKPLLQVLPTGPSHAILKLFERRTIYANAVNDGIVPLRTSAVLYLDWRGLSEVQLALQSQGISEKEKKAVQEISESKKDIQNLHSSDVSEIPEFKSEAASELNNPGSENEGLLSSISNAAVTPVQGLLSFFAPSAQKKVPEEESFSKVSSVYKYSQTLPPSAEDSPPSHDLAPDTQLHSKNNQNNHQSSKSETCTVKSGENEQIAGAASNSQSMEPSQSQALNPPARQQKLGLPKKTSVFESGVSVILPPLPPESFAVDPSTRQLTIVHDRYYHDYDLPSKRTHPSKSNFNSSTGAESDKQANERPQLEERIARAWHKGLTWRKVLVRLEPDAHNNIIVRRRFANAYGWPVIDHLVEEHFIKPSMGLYDSSKTQKGKHSSGYSSPLSFGATSIVNLGLASTRDWAKEKSPLAALRSISSSSLVGFSAGLKSSNNENYNKTNQFFTGSQHTDSGNRHKLHSIDTEKSKNLIPSTTKTHKFKEDDAQSSNANFFESYSSDESEASAQEGLLKFKSKTKSKNRGHSNTESNTNDMDDDTYSTCSDNTETWDAYLYHNHADKEDDGIIYQMGNMFDNIREIGNLNFGALGDSNNKNNNSFENLSRLQETSKNEKKSGTQPMEIKPKPGVNLNQKTESSDKTGSNPFFPSFLKTSLFKGSASPEFGSQSDATKKPQKGDAESTSSLVNPNTLSEPFKRFRSPFGGASVPHSQDSNSSLGLSGTAEGKNKTNIFTNNSQAHYDSMSSSRSLDLDLDSDLSKTHSESVDSSLSELGIAGSVLENGGMGREFF